MGIRQDIKDETELMLDGLYDEFIKRIAASNDTFRENPLTQKYYDKIDELINRAERNPDYLRK